MALSITSLHIYPIKSMHGISLQEAQLSDRGFLHDRRWMLIDEDHVFLSQRSFPSLARFRVAMTETELLISFEGEELRVSLYPQDGERLRVTIWDDVCDALAVSTAADVWFSTRLGRSCRLVYMTDDSHRAVDPRYGAATQGVSFADGYPFLMLSEESIADLNRRLPSAVPASRFRANILIAGGEAYIEDSIGAFSIRGVQFVGAKPCARCQVITIDQQSGEVMGKEPLATLATYRRDGNKVLFGMNLLHTGTGFLRVGDVLIPQDVSQNF